MENASNALIIGGTVLIALIVLSMGVYLVITHQIVGEAYENTIDLAEIENYNSHFARFEGEDKITAQEVVTLIKFSRKYKNSSGAPITKIEASTINQNISGDYTNTERYYANKVNAANPELIYSGSGKKIEYHYYLSFLRIVLWSSLTRKLSRAFWILLPLTHPSRESSMGSVASHCLARAVAKYHACIILM